MFRYLLILISMIYAGSFKRKIIPFSFDITAHEYPLEYLKMGTSVALRDTIKLIPKVENRYGAIFLKEQVETSQYMVVYKLDVKNDRNTIYKRVDGHTVDDIEGVALWYIHHKPDEKDLSTAFGYRADFNGIGVYLFKHQDQWRIMSIFNKGLQGLTVETAVNNLTTPDNNCMLPNFNGGPIDIHFTVEHERLSVDYDLHDNQGPKACILSKAYSGFGDRGYIGVSSGNPVNQNVNEIDVYGIDFYNMNPNFYKHDNEITDGQTYYHKDENGFVGKTNYPWSAKLDTIEMGKVAIDILETKRLTREFYKEQYQKSLHIITNDDDIAETRFKLFEQLRSTNDDLQQHLELQKQKKQGIKQLEKVLLRADDYEYMLRGIKVEDEKLYGISQKFADLTSEAKKILDEIKYKSSELKEEHGIDETVEVDYKNHHKTIPRDMKVKLLETAKEVDNLHLTFDKFTLQTQSAVLSLHESQERVMKMRSDASISNNDDVFSEFYTKVQSKAEEVIGSRGKGIYQDSVLQQIEDKVHERTLRLEKIIRERQESENWLSMVLTISSIVGIIALWVKMQQTLGGTASKRLGGYNMGGGGSQEMNYI